MAKNFLIITEGVRTEPTILEAILEKYGFNVVRKKPIKISIEEQPFILEATELFDNKKDNVYIAQGPKNRIREFLHMVNEKTEDVERYFSQLSDNFAGIFRCMMSIIHLKRIWKIRFLSFMMKQQVF